MLRAGAESSDRGGSSGTQPMHGRPENALDRIFADQWLFGGRFAFWPPGDSMKQPIRRDLLRKPQTRLLAMQGAAVDTATRTAQLSFSSEDPVTMWYGTEVLSHAKGAMQLGTRQQNLNLLFNHDPDDVLGVVESIGIENRRGVATVRFGKDPRGDWAMQQVQDGILRNVSVGYQVNQYQADAEDPDVIVATNWSVFELTLCTIPADATVGVGRSLSFSQGNFMETDELSRTQRRALAADENARLDAVAAERTRIGEISALAERFGLPTEVSRRMISDGTSIVDARQRVLEMRGDRVEPVSSANTRELSARSVGITERELRNYSLFKAVRAAAMPREANFQREAGFEMEVSAALAQRSPTEIKGFAVPPEVLNVLRSRSQRAPVFADSGSGANLVENTLLADAYITPQYIQPRVLAAGATVLSGLSGNTLVPKMTAADQVAWLAAEGSAYSNTQPTFAQITLAPKDIAAYVDLSRRLLLQSTPAAESLIRSDLATVISVAIDQAAIAGAGSGGVPLGILNQSGIGLTPAGVNGGSITYAIIGAMVGQLAAANALYGKLSWLATGPLAAHMMATPKFTYGSQTLWEPPLSKEPVPGEGSIMYSSSFISNNCPANTTKGTGTNLHSLILGNWTDLLIGQWGVLQILADPYSQSSTGTTRLTAIQTLDVQVRHAASFSVCTDLLTT